MKKGNAGSEYQREIRNPNIEALNKFKSINVQNSKRLGYLIFEFRYCLGFRAWDFVLGVM